MAYLLASEQASFINFAEDPGWFANHGSDDNPWQLTHEACACEVAMGQSDGHVFSSSLQLILSRDSLGQRATEPPSFR
jgi:hypothetical protein